MQYLTGKRTFGFYVWLGPIFLALLIIRNLIWYPAEFWERLINSVWWLSYLTLLNFVLFEYLVPFVIRKRKYLVANILIGIFLLYLFLMFCSFGLYAWRLLGLELHLYTIATTFESDEPITHKMIYDTMSGFITHQMTLSMMLVFFFGIIRHVYYYIRLNQLAQKLLIEKQAAELNYLKSQTNPHFLFNTLNNIYALAEKQSNRTSESVLRLSKLLRYMLYDTTAAHVTIEQEIRVITDYIALEKLRFDDSLQLYFNHHIEDMKQRVPPLLLIPLVENAFKHGASETRGKAFVNIELTIHRSQLIPGKKLYREGICNRYKREYRLVQPASSAGAIV